MISRGSSYVVSSFPSSSIRKRSSNRWCPLNWSSLCDDLLPLRILPRYFWIIFTPARLVIVSWAPSSSPSHSPPIELSSCKALALVPSILGVMELDPALAKEIINESKNTRHTLDNSNDYVIILTNDTIHHNLLTFGIYWTFRCE